MADLLRQAGAMPLLYPCLAIWLPEDTGALDTALKDAAVGEYDRLLLTSANTVYILAQRLADLGITLSGLSTVAIGPKTAEAAETLLGVDVTLVARKHVAESLAEEMAPVSGERLVLPQSTIARPVLAEKLAADGAWVTVVDAYHTGLGQGGEPVPDLLAGNAIEAITFTSSSTVTNFLQRLDKDGGDRHQLAGVCLAAIGPVTATTMTKSALSVDVLADDYTLAGLVDALAAHFVRV
jgi:uroporphyrinogen-III synthase